MAPEERLDLVTRAMEVIEGHCGCQSKGLELQAQTVLLAQMKYEELSNSAADKNSRRQFIFNALENADEGRYKILTSSPVRFCGPCWCAFNGCPPSTFYNNKRKWMEGNRDIEHGNTGKTNTRMNTAFASEYLEYQKNSFGDYMPHNCKVMMPPYDQAQFYSMYCLRILSAENGGVPVSKETFRNLIVADTCMCFRSMRSKKSAFADCDTCHALKKQQSDLIRQMIVPKSQFQVIKLILKAHIDHTNAERLQYRCNAMQSLLQSDDFISIVIDAMDQFKSNMPYMERFPKELDKLERIRNRLIGVLVHGHSPAKHVFHIFENVASDSNLTLTILLMVLQRVEAARKTKGKKLPRKLFLQLDNCPAENKNRFVFSVLYW
jgi:hypothetical protein